jgi:hypothetical protein
LILNRSFKGDCQHIAGFFFYIFRLCARLFGRAWAETGKSTPAFALAELRRGKAHQFFDNFLNTDILVVFLVKLEF